VTVRGRTSAQLEAAFDTIAPIDLATIFERFLLVPGVRGVRDQSGSWDTAGRTRIVLLTDGSEVPERLTMVNRPRAFAYRLGPFPRPLGLLVAYADGEWAFSEDGRGGTSPSPPVAQLSRRCSPRYGAATHAERSPAASQLPTAPRRTAARHEQGPKAERRKSMSFGCWCLPLRCPAALPEPVQRSSRRTRWWAFMKPIAIEGRWLFRWGAVPR
jgi:hypothetical protein